MTITITAELTSAEATTRLEMILARIDRRQGLMKAIGDLLVGSAGENFRAERGPDGAAWAPLAPSTIRARARRARSQIRILSETGALAGSVHAEATDDLARIGSPTAYAAIHQLGGTIQKAAGSRTMVGRRFARRGAEGGREAEIMAHSITIPARPFLGVSAEDAVSILEMAEDWLAGSP